jgi:hypothetical protein
MTTSGTKAIAAAVMAAALAAGVLAAKPDGSRSPAPAGETPSDPTGVLPGKSAEPPGNGTAGLEAKLRGFWNGRGDCQGDVTFKADGTYSWIQFGPGSATVAGKWSVRWDALPPTLVMTSTASTDRDYTGVTAEVKVLQLDGKTLVYEQNGYKVTFTREPSREPKEQQDARLIRGRWKVVKDEYRDGTKWVAADVPPDLAFAFSADGVTICRGKASLGFRLTLQPDEKAMNLVRAEGGTDRLVTGHYRLQEDRLTICVVGHLLPAEVASKAATLRLYHLERAVEPKP